MKILKSQLFKQLTVLVILVGIIVSSIVCTQASIYQVSGLFGSSVRQNVFKGKTDFSGAVGDVTRYPIKVSNDDIGPEFEKLGFDILLGTKRDMVNYTGEIPRQWKDKEGLTLVPYSNYSAISYEYWGIKSPNHLISDWKVEEGQELAKVEEWAGEKDGDAGSSEITSIRMYALTRASSFTIVENGLGNAFYIITQGLCDLSAGILKVFISVKNISIAKVLQELHLDKLVKLFNKVLLKNNGQLSAFMIIAIISFIFAIAGYAINFARGSKKSSLKDILILGFCGLTVVSLSLSNNPTSLGTNAANAVSNLTQELVYDSIAGGKDIWQSKAKGISYDSTEISYNETTLINKTLIELQILNQFGVDDINDLDISKFGGVSDIGFQKLPDEERNLQNFGSNLGYYYWFANSPSPVYSGDLTNTFRGGVYNSSKVDVRLEAIMSYLQKAYNEAPDNKTKSRILSIVDSFANNNMGNGTVMYLLLTIEYALLCLVLARLVLRILLGKILISGSVLGLPIAGPLLITTRKTCVNAAKLILLTLVTYSIQVFVLSVLFDLILNVIGVIITPNISSIFLALAITVGLFVFLPKLYRELDKLFATINSAIGAGQITQYQRGASQYVSGKFNSLKGKTREKTITQLDADGNEVQTVVTQSTGLAKAAAVTAALAGYGEGNRGTNIRNIKKIGEQNIQNKVNKSVALSKEMHGRTDEAFRNVQNAREEVLNRIYGGVDAEHRNFGNINAQELHENEALDYSILRSEYDSILNNDRFTELRNRRAQISTDSAEYAELQQYDSALRDVTGRQTEFNQRIQQRVSNEIRDAHADEIAEVVSAEVRTNEKAIKEGKTNKVTLKLHSLGDSKSKDNTELGTIVDNSVESTNKELTELYGMNNKNQNEIEIEKRKGKVASGVASTEEKLRVIRERNTNTETSQGSAHEQYQQDVTQQLNSRRIMPFGRNKNNNNNNNNNN